MSKISEWWKDRNRLDKMVIVTHILMGKETYRLKSHSNEYWWAVFRAIQKYHVEDVFIANIKAGKEYVSLLPDSIVNKTIITHGHTSAFTSPEFVTLIDSLNPRELIIFGQLPVSTCLDAVEWVRSEEGRTLSIRDELCRYEQTEKDRAEILGLSDPPKIKIYPSYFMEVF